MSSDSEGFGWVFEVEEIFSAVYAVVRDYGYTVYHNRC